jgi:plastocyanin
MCGPRIRIVAILTAAVIAVSLSGATAALGKRPARALGREPLAAKTLKVKIVDFAFKPKTVRIEVGERVKWTNTGDRTHTSTSNTDVWDSKNLGSGESFTRKFKKAGTFKYHCEIHEDMKGKVVVG